MSTIMNISQEFHISSLQISQTWHFDMNEWLKQNVLEISIKNNFVKKKLSFRKNSNIIIKINRPKKFDQKYFSRGKIWLFILNLECTHNFFEGDMLVIVNCEILHHLKVFENIDTDMYTMGPNNLFSNVLVLYPLFITHLLNKNHSPGLIPWFSNIRFFYGYDNFSDNDPKPRDNVCYVKHYFWNLQSKHTLWAYFIMWRM